MRSILLTAWLAASTAALAIGKRNATNSEPLYTIEIAPGETLQVTEAEKWVLKAQGINFMDITDFSDLGKVGISIERRQLPQQAWPKQAP